MKYLLLTVIISSYVAAMQTPQPSTPGRPKKPSSQPQQVIVSPIDHQEWERFAAFMAKINHQNK